MSTVLKVWYFPIPSIKLLKLWKAPNKLKRFLSSLLNFPNLSAQSSKSHRPYIIPSDGVQYPPIEETPICSCYDHDHDQAMLPCRSDKALGTPKWAGAFDRGTALLASWKPCCRACSTAFSTTPCRFASSNLKEEALNSGVEQWWITHMSFVFAVVKSGLHSLNAAWCSTNSSAAHRETKTNMSYADMSLPDAGHPTPQNNLSSAG